MVNAILVNLPVVIQSDVLLVFIALESVMILQIRLARLDVMILRTVLVILQYVILGQTNARLLQYRVMQVMRQLNVLLLSTARMELVLLDAELMDLLQQQLVHSVLVKLNL
jgi:hypothetical protein